MARCWCLRNTLLLGLGLLIASASLLLIVQAIDAHASSIDATDRKFSELLLLNELKQDLLGLKRSLKDKQSDPCPERDTVLEKLATARKRFEDYKKRFEDGADRDPEPFIDPQFVGDVDRSFDALEDAAMAGDDYRATKEQGRLLQLLKELRLETVKDLHGKFRQARDDSNQISWIVSATTIFGMFLALFLLLYGWASSRQRSSAPTSQTAPISMANVSAAGLSFT